MNKIQQIIQGWKNNLIRDEEVEKIAIPRLEICANCELNSSYPKELNLLSTCTSCGCNLNAKVRCVKCSCPKNKWN